MTAALILGVLASLVLTELVGLSAGGIVVPGYVALLLDRPSALIGFLAIALASYGLLRTISNALMLYGNRRFAVALLIGLALASGASYLSPYLMPAYVEWVGLGFIVPGLVAHQFDRQGVLPTLLMLAIAAPIVRAALAVVMWL
ncbi:MAG: poly-gamma-glutamate biosynthesis protein PgsC [Bauldia sp.]